MVLFLSYISFLDILLTPQYIVTLCTFGEPVSIKNIDSKKEVSYLPSSFTICVSIQLFV